MAFSVVLVAALCAFASSARAQDNPSPKPYTECTKPGGEFFYLVQQWPPGYCQEDYCAKSAPGKFTIHGLWPNYCQEKSGRFWPQFCAGRGLNLQNLSDLVPTMEEEWPSLSNSGNPSFWEHEWDKHGTCALAYTPFGLNSQHEYFETALQLHKDADLYGALKASKIVPGSDFKPQEYQAALQTKLGGTAFLHCSRDNTLIEIYTCYNQALQLVPCSHLGTCNESQDVTYVEP